MNSHCFHHDRRWPRVPVGLTYCLGGVLALSPIAPGADRPAALTTETNEFQLFIGLEVHVAVGNEIGRIRNVTRSKAEVVLDEAVRTIPVDRLVTRRFDHTAKVSATRVTIRNPQGERAAPELDSSMYDVVVDQATQQLQAEQEKRRDDDNEAFYESVYNPKANQGDIDRERLRQEINARALASMPRSDVDLFAHERFLDLEHQQAATGSDVLKVSFEISAPERIPDAYVTVFAILHHPIDPQVPIHRVIIRKLPALGPKPETVRVAQGGMPTGFEIESFDIHVYANGREVASNVAHGSVDVTREEAMRFLRLQRLQAHARQTLPPTLMAEFLPAGIGQVVPTDQAKRKVRVTIDPRGIPVAIALDHRSRNAADDAIEEMIRAASFLPAMREGMPVESEITMSLGEFVR